MSFAVIVPFLLAQAPVVLERRVATVGAAVAELARKSGRDLRVRRELDDEAVFVSLGPHSPDELMALVARAASAEWARDGAATWLERSPTLRRHQEAADAQADGALLARRLAPYLDPNDARPDGAKPAGAARRAVAGLGAVNSTADFLRVEAARRALSPVGRLLSRVLRATPSAALGGLVPGHAFHYAPRPNPWERPLAGTGEASLRMYVEERNALVDGLAGLSVRDANRVRQAMGMVSQGEATIDPDPVPKLRILRQSGAGYLIVLQVLDRRGGPLDQADFFLEDAVPSAGVALPHYAEWASRPVRLGPVAAAFAKALGGALAPPDLAQPAADPVANEPLALWLGDALADGVGGEMVCALPDVAGAAAARQLQEAPKLGEVADALATGVAFETSDGVTVGRASAPSLASRTKASRAALRGFIAELRRGAPRLETLARYTRAQRPDVGFSGFEELAFRAAGVMRAGDVAQGLGRNRDLVRLYGALSPAAREALADGAPLPAGNLGPDARADLETYLFTRSTEVELQHRGGASTVAQAVWLADAPGAPLGIVCPRPMRLLSLLARDEAGRMFRTNPLSLGSSLKAEPRLERATFLPTSETDYPIEIRLTPDATTRVTLVDDDSDRSGRLVPLADLPLEFRAAVERGGRPLP